MRSSELTYGTFIAQLLAEVPEFGPIYNAHVDYYDVLLPHVLMGDFTRFLFDVYRRSISETDNSGQWQQLVARSLSLMERAINSSDIALQNLISVSFIENLLPSKEDDLEVYNDLKKLLGTRLREELKLYDPD